MRHLVAGAGGFIGGHLVAALLERGDEVVAADVKPLHRWWQLHEAGNWREDLRKPGRCHALTVGVDRVWNLACNMGGIGFIEGHRAECMRSVLINTNLIEAARENRVGRYLYASSACVYPAHRQDSPDVPPLEEDAAYPADPEDGYGWEKLFGERMCRHYHEDFGLEVRVPRIHNAYGPRGSWKGGREKAPAALCRKVATAIRDRNDTLEVWGNGEQVRSFMHVDDCVEGLLRIMNGESPDPVNLGSDESVTVNQLAGLVEEVAGVRLKREYRLDRPQGVAGRNSDNTRIRNRYGWAPSVTLREGLPETYHWIEGQVARQAPEDDGAVT